MKIQVVDYIQNWNYEYIIEEQSLKTFLQEELVNSIRIGGISVPGLKAKPVN
ncbi:hypothetical protein SFC15_15165 [Shouchella clausii]